MIKLIAIVAALALAIYFLLGHAQSGAGSGDPVTSSISEDLKAKAQAELTMRITTTRNGMEQLMALGSIDALAAKATLDDLTSLHADVEEQRRVLLTLGDGKAQVDRLFARLRWDDFLAVEAQFRKMITN